MIAQIVEALVNTIVILGGAKYLIGGQRKRRAIGLRRHERKLRDQEQQLSEYRERIEQLEKFVYRETLP
jgi:hypothetical protein